MQIAIRDKSAVISIPISAIIYKHIIYANIFQIVFSQIKIYNSRRILIRIDAILWHTMSRLLHHSAS